MIVQLGPKECLAVSSDISYEGTILRNILGRSNILITETKKGLLYHATPTHLININETADFNSKDIIQDLNRILKLPPTRSSSSLRKISINSNNVWLLL